jgi:hypothetical protein
MSNLNYSCPSCNQTDFIIHGCFDKNTQIPLYVKHIDYLKESNFDCHKLVEELKIGDILIGDDGKPRTIVNIFSGYDRLYKIIQSNGLDYIVNSRHTLILKYINPKQNIYESSNRTQEISVDSYINLNDDTYKQFLYGFHFNNSTILSSIQINPIGYNKYYGFELDPNTNQRFILSDGTVVKNCSIFYCSFCNK